MREILTKEVGEVERICVKFMKEVSERKTAEPFAFWRLASRASTVRYASIVRYASTVPYASTVR